MKLNLKKFICIDATDDPGGDSPYFVVFVGKPKDLPPVGRIKVSDLDFQIATVRKKSWDDKIHDVTVRSPNLIVANEKGHALHVDGNSCVLVALCEQDDDVDVTHDERHDILRDLRVPWVEARGGDANASGPDIAHKIRHKFAAIVDDALSNDDLLGVARLRPTAGSHTVHYQRMDDGYHYEVEFELQ
jgi:hypothetical protein